MCNQDCISHLNYLLFYVNIIKGFQFDEHSVNGSRGYTFHTMEINDHDFQNFAELDVLVIIHTGCFQCYGLIDLNSREIFILISTFSV